MKLKKIVIIFLTMALICGFSLSETTNWLTDYDYGSRIELGTPKLVKLNSDKFLLMWEERISI